MSRKIKIVKSKISVLVLFVFLLALISPSASAAPFKGRGPAQKFGRGIFHITTAIFQLPKEIIQKTADAGEPAAMAPLEGFFVGMGSGIYLGIRQLVSGFTDVFTFYTPMERDWGPIYEPATMFPEI